MRSGIWKALLCGGRVLSARRLAFRRKQMRTDYTSHPRKAITSRTISNFRTARRFPRSGCTTRRSARRTVTRAGSVTNAVLILHGTNRAGRRVAGSFFRGRAFGPGQLLDASKYYLILPDQLGAGLGKSTKPSDGLRAKFPHYDYSDMVRASQILLAQGLQVNHLHLLVGASMGCMEGFMWGESNPDDMDAMLLLSCLPVEVASRNRMVRKIMVDDIRLDPGWNNGNYTEQPYGLRAALGHLLVVGSVPTRWQKEYPTAAAGRQIRERIHRTEHEDDGRERFHVSV